MDNKKPWLSKTVWAGTIAALAGLASLWGVLPGLSAWVNSHGDIILTGLGTLGVALRAVTKGKISLE